MNRGFGRAQALAQERRTRLDQIRDHLSALEPLLSEAEQAKAEKDLAAAGHGRLLHLGRSDEALVREMIEKHLRFTGSTLALAIVDDWEAARRKFVKVFPVEYKRALSEMHEAKAADKAASVKVAA